MSLSFRLANAGDKQLVVSFLDANWGVQHPLVHIPEYFDFYYNNGAGIQFAFAEENGEIVAIAGYIRANESKTPDIWVSIWCAKKGCNGAGLELMDALPKLTNAHSMSCNNIRPKTMAFYTFLGYYAGRLPHYYRLSGCDEYKVARIVDNIILPAGGNAQLVRVENAEALAQVYKPCENARPYKDIWYITRRYFNYPHQKYDVWAQKGGNALLVTRTVDVEGTNVLRIVDYIGANDNFKNLGAAIDNLMKNEKAEYADCYCFGISAENFAAAGFCERKEDGANIIPNYLTPPLYENTEYYFFTDNAENFTMFKADGDQDRPNIGY